MIQVLPQCRRRSGAAVIWVFHDVTDLVWFRRCIDSIASARDVIRLDDLAREPERTGVCAITFDDGLRSVWTVAHPLLGAWRIPYTVFVCTDVLVGGPVPWFLRALRLIACVGPEPLVNAWDLPRHQMKLGSDVVEALKPIPLPALLDGLAALEDDFRLRPPDPRDLFLTVEEVRALSQSGADVGSHTHRHAILSRLNDQEQQAEIEESVEIVEQVTGRKPTQFAYPNGRPEDFDERAVKVLRETGIAVAVTTTQRYLGAAEDILKLPRIGVTDGESALHMSAKQVALSLSPRIATGLGQRRRAYARTR